MSEQGFKGIPGVPEGWELVRIGKPEIGEWFLDGLGHLSQAKHDGHWQGRAIIRKIETPKKYRPFANAEEFKPHRDRWVRIVSAESNCCDLDDWDVGHLQSITGYSEGSVCIWEGWMTYGEAFECFAFDDGTPFGVEVTE
jgi:hypothetical protein